MRPIDGNGAYDRGVVTSEMVPLQGRPLRDRAVVWLHGVLFVMTFVVAFLDVGRGSFSFTGQLASALAVPLVALVLGTIRASRRAPGWPAILAVADLAIAASAPAVLLTPTFADEVNVLAVSLALVAIPALFSLVIATDGSRRGKEEGPRFARTPLQWAIVAAILVLVVVPLAGLTGGRASPANLLAIVVPSLGVAVVALTAWWLGWPWLLFVQGVGAIALRVELAINGQFPLALDMHVLAPIVAIGALLVAPRDVREARRPAAPTPDEPAPGSGPVTGVAASKVWLGLGAILFVPALLIGLFPPIIEDCFEGCPQRFPAADLLLGLDAVGAVVVLVAAFAVAVGQPVGGPRRALYPAAALVAAALVFGQIVLGYLGWRPFFYLPGAAPVALLVTVGAAVALLRPAWLRTAGWVSACAMAGVAFVWIWSAAGRAQLSLGQAVAIVEAGLLMVLIARESSSGRDPGEHSRQA